MIYILKGGEPLWWQSRINNRLARRGSEDSCVFYCLKMSNIPSNMPFSLCWTECWNRLLECKNRKGRKNYVGRRKKVLDGSLIAIKHFVQHLLLFFVLDHFGFVYSAHVQHLKENDVIRNRTECFFQKFEKSRNKFKKMVEKLLAPMFFFWNWN